MNIDILLGLQWGDEGKGKIVDALAPEYDISCTVPGRTERRTYHRIS